MIDYRWEKKGLIYVPNGKEIFRTHTTRSIPYKIDEKTLRLYFASRDFDDRPIPNYIDVDIENPNKILFINDKPLLKLGNPGYFDDSGITPTCILPHNDEILLYYAGWKRRRIYVTIEASIGLCRLSHSGKILNRVFDGPILSQDKNHPLFATGAFVLYDDKKFKMWYNSGTEWRICNENPEMIYNVHYAESKNGIDWVSRAKPVVDYKYDGEVISTPWVIKHNSKYYMWYSIRGSRNKVEKKYEIGYAESSDGIKWVRMDEQVGISKSRSGWDSEMICYPSFFPYKNKIYMFYSGNNVGKGGLGYAVIDKKGFI